MTAKTYRVKSTFAERAKREMINYITKNKEGITEAEIINAALYKGFLELKDSDILKYIEAVESKRIE